MTAAFQYSTAAVEPTNKTNTTAATSPQRDEDLAKYEIGVQTAIFILAVLGNGIVLLVLGLRRKKLSRMNSMIIHLSLADLFVAFFNVLPQLIWDITNLFYGGDFLCRAVKYLQLVAMYASSYVLVTCALDRFICLCFPLKTHVWTLGRMHWLVGVAWALGLAFSLPQVFIFSHQELAPGLWNCWGQFPVLHTVDTMPLYITWITLTIYIVPLVLLLFLYGRICFVVWTSMQIQQCAANGRENGSLLRADVLSTPTSGGGRARVVPRAHTQRVSKAKVKTVKLTLAVVSCYLICWGPFFVAQMWAAWDPAAPFQGHTFVVLMLLASLNSCTNPWIFLCFTDVMKRLRERRMRGEPRARATWADSTFTSRGAEVSHTDYTRVDTEHVAMHDVTRQQ